MTSEFIVADSGKQAARVRALWYLGLPHWAAAERAPHGAEVHSVLWLFQVAAVTAVQFSFTHGSVVLHCHSCSCTLCNRPFGRGSPGQGFKISLSALLESIEIVDDRRYHRSRELYLPVHVIGF